MPVGRSIHVLAVAVGALALGATCASAAPAVFTDPAGDTEQGPDVTRVAVGDDGRTLTMGIRIANRDEGPLDTDVYTIYLDTDESRATGDPEHHGADRLVRVAGGAAALEATLARWAGEGWGEGTPSGVTVEWNEPELAVRVGLAGLGDPDGDVRLSVAAAWTGIVDYYDYAPDDQRSSFVYAVGGGTPPDTRPPDTRIVGGPSGATRAHTATFRFAASEPGSTFMCRLDGRAWRACGSPKSYRGLARGRHVFRVAARDRAGNLDPTPAVRAWRVG
jgi:hypothetical protein